MVSTLVCPDALLRWIVSQRADGKNVGNWHWCVFCCWVGPCGEMQAGKTATASDDVSLFVPRLDLLSCFLC